MATVVVCFVVGLPPVTPGNAADMQESENNPSGWDARDGLRFLGFPADYTTESSPGVPLLGPDPHPGVRL